MARYVDYAAFRQTVSKRVIFALPSRAHAKASSAAEIILPIDLANDERMPSCMQLVVENGATDGRFFSYMLRILALTQVIPPNFIRLNLRTGGGSTIGTALEEAFEAAAVVACNVDSDAEYEASPPGLTAQAAMTTFNRNAGDPLAPLRHLTILAALETENLIPWRIVLETYRHLIVHLTHSQPPPPPAGSRVGRWQGAASPPIRGVAVAGGGTGKGTGIVD
jgi:hypothetical protein